MPFDLEILYHKFTYRTKKRSGTRIFAKAWFIVINKQLLRSSFLD